MKVNGIARRDITGMARIRRNVGFLLLEFGSLRASQLLGPGATECQVLFVHRLWITMGVWEFVSLDQLP